MAAQNAFMRWLGASVWTGLLVLPLFAAGCVMPLPLTIASLAAGGVSYAVSGKGIADHALSAVVSRDCATWRMLQGQPPCRAATPDSVARAADYRPEDYVARPWSMAEAAGVHDLQPRRLPLIIPAGGPRNPPAADGSTRRLWRDRHPR